MTLYDPDEPSTKPGGPSAKPGGPPANPAVHQQNPAVHQVIKGMLKKVMTAQREKTVSRKRRLRRQSRGRYAMSMSSLKWMNFR